MWVEILTSDGPKKAKVCLHCRTVIIQPKEMYCSGSCYAGHFRGTEEAFRQGRIRLEVPRSEED